ncbi:TPA: hypothetical protein ACIVK9_005592 [Salmonella enterica subsp. enterica serovar Muenchen]
MPETVFNHPSIKKEKLTNICALLINSRRVSGTVWLDLSVTAFLNIRQEWKRTSGAEKKGGVGLPPEFLSEYATPLSGVLWFIFWV